MFIEQQDALKYIIYNINITTILKTVQQKTSIKMKNMYM